VSELPEEDISKVVVQCRQYSTDISMKVGVNHVQDRNYSGLFALPTFTYRARGLRGYKLLNEQ
jgi:hypothetical protein